MVLLGVLVMNGAGQSSAASNEVLENGSLRIIFNPGTGLFDIHSVAGSMIDLNEVGPSVQVDGHELAPGDAKNIDVRRRPFSDEIGSGQKLVIRYAFIGALSELRYEIGVFKDKPWLTITAYLPQGSYRLGDVDLIHGKARVTQAFRSKL